MPKEYIPEVEELSSEGNPLKECTKPWNHDKWVNVTELEVNSLPIQWQKIEVLNDFKVSL